MAKPSAKKPIPPEALVHYMHGLVNHMRGLGYRQRRIFLWHRVKPRLDRFLYKFRALVPDNKMSVDHMRDIVVRSHLWLSSPVDFNDPFDMAAKYIVEGTVKEKRQRFQEILKGQSIKWSVRTRQLPGLVAKTNEEIAAVVQQVHRGNVKVTGVCPFGGDPRSILMWSHYASNHAKPDIVAKLHGLLEERASAGFPPPRLYRAVEHETKYKLVIRRFR